MLRPDAADVGALNRSLQDRLHIALDHIVNDVLSATRAATWPVDPCVFALQDRFRAAAVAGDIAELRHLHDRYHGIFEGVALPPGLQVLSWGDNRITGSGWELLQDAFRDDIGLTAQLVPSDPARVATLRASITRLLDDLDDILPAWADEFRAFVSWILLAQTSGGKFGGASAFAAWGAILINPQTQTDDLTLLLTLIHESAHLKLFSAWLDDEVVLNDPDDTYASPLRAEPRPMNGIYHAAFVLARMACFLDDLRQCGQEGLLLGASAARLPATLSGTVSAFEAGLEEIRRHGRLTARGTAIIDEAADAVALIVR
jgi:hypothetical protein